MAHEAGKGSAQRPTNNQAFSEAFDRIFGVTSKQLGHVDCNEEMEEDDEDEICSGCSGSGEGMYDGSSCYKCHGSCVEPVEREDAP